MTTIGYCPQCGTRRVGTMRFCTQCRFDFQSIRSSPAGTLTSLTRSSPPSQPPAAAAPMPQTAAVPVEAEHTEPNQTVAVLAGIAWLIGAAAIGFLALLQLQYSSFGFPDSDEAMGLAAWNGITALITAYFGAMAIIKPSAGRMAGGVVWAVLNVAFGAYQVSQGVSHEAFILALVAFSVAGVLAFVVWIQLRGHR